MKKIYSLLTVLALSTVGMAQVNIQDYNGGSPTGPSLNGDTIYRTISDNELVVVDLGVTNTSGIDKQYDVTRLKIIDVPAWGPTEQICWGYQVEGNCYTTPYINPNPWTSPTWGSPLPDQASANLKFDIHSSSTGIIHYRFIVKEGSTLVDSVDVYVSTGLSTKAPKTEEVSLSVYPNPVSNTLSIATQGLGDDFNVKITDVLGKVVYNDSASAATKKIDVSEFKNGVYMVTVSEKGIATQTRRIVVKH